MMKDKLHFKITNVVHPEYKNQLRVQTSHLIDSVRGTKHQRDYNGPWVNLGSCQYDGTAVYHTNSMNIIKHFSRVFLDSAHLNSHLENRSLSIKYYDDRGNEYIITDRTPNRNY